MNNPRKTHEEGLICCVSCITVVLQISCDDLPIIHEAHLRMQNKNESSTDQTLTRRMKFFLLKQ